MSVLTIRVPDAKHQRLKHLAKSRGISVNKLIEELSTVALAQHDAEMRFRVGGARLVGTRIEIARQTRSRLCAEFATVTVAVVYLVGTARFRQSNTS